jgi:site-specific recombinase XerD
VLLYHFAELQKGEILFLREARKHAPESPKLGSFRNGKQNAKSDTVAVIVRAARRARLDYPGFLYACQQARRKLKLTRPKRERKLPHLLPVSALKRFFQVIQNCGDVQHEILLKLLFYTAVRVRELVRIRIGDVDLEQCRIFIQQGKGPKDRYILFPASFRLVLRLRSHLKSHPENRYLFETTRCGPFTTRRIQQIVQSYRARAHITQPVHPHLFRHQMLTYLTAQGLSDAQLQLISGHASKKSLEIYQHLSLEAVEDAYQAAVRALEI